MTTILVIALIVSVFLNFHQHSQKEKEIRDVIDTMGSNQEMMLEACVSLAKENRELKVQLDRKNKEIYNEKFNL